MYVATKINWEGPKTPKSVDHILMTKDLDLARKALVVAASRMVDEEPDYACVIENGDFIRIISNYLHERGFNLECSTTHILCVKEVLNVDIVHYDDSKQIKES